MAGRRIPKQMVVESVQDGRMVVLFPADGCGIFGGVDVGSALSKIKL